MIFLTTLLALSIRCRSIKPQTLSPIIFQVVYKKALAQYQEVFFYLLPSAEDILQCLFDYMHKQCVKQYRHNTGD